MFMCAEYEVRTSQRKIEDALQRRVGNNTGQDSWDLHVRFTDLAPVIELENGNLAIKKRVFPAHPFPNARLSGAVDGKNPSQIKKIFELPTWKQGFEKERCVVIATQFLEPAYWGPSAGAVMKFALPDNEVFFIAAIAIRPNKPATGTRNGFALLTHSATEQMLEFHHRLVVALKPEHALEYLSFPPIAAPSEILEYLVNHRYAGQLNYSVARQMAKGWEKRVQAHKEDLRSELEYIETLKHQ